MYLVALIIISIKNNGSIKISLLVNYTPCMWQNEKEIDHNSLKYKMLLLQQNKYY